VARRNRPPGFRGGVAQWVTAEEASELQAHGTVVTDPSGRGFWVTDEGGYGFPRSYAADPPRRVRRSRYVEVEFDEADVTFRGRHGAHRVARYTVIREIPAVEMEAMVRRRHAERRLALIGNSPRFAAEADELRQRRRRRRHHLGRAGAA
jgi:hypothetical protein